MRLSVTICTWNRAGLLDKTLTEMHDLRIPDQIAWELLIVNNNCTDNTDAIVRRHADFLPVRKIFEPTPGLSNARNAAVEAATGDYLLWTDDDVLVDEGWIEAYVRAIEAWPDAAILGGPIAPWFEGRAPKWLENCWSKVANAYAVRDLGSEYIPLSERKLPFGANYAVRLSAHKHYAYDPTLGRKGKGMVGYEESTLITAMLRDGFSGIWVPEARVRHFIPRERQSVQYVQRYFHGQGLYLAGREEKSEVPRFFGYPRWLVKRVFLSTVKYWIHKVFCDPNVWIDYLIKDSMLRGTLRGSRLNGAGE